MYQLSFRPSESLYLERARLLVEGKLYRNAAASLGEAMLEEHFFSCPYCWEQISMLLDLTGGAQSYVEDCEICCRPITISFDASDGTLSEFSADPVS